MAFYALDAWIAVAFYWVPHSRNFRSGVAVTVGSA